jgi:putative ABC transport system permease protein
VQNLFSCFSLILRNGFRCRRRSFLTVLSTAAAFCLLGVLMAMYSFFFLTPISANQALRLIVRNRISIANPLPVSYVERIAKVPGVRGVMIQQWFGGTYKDSSDPRNNFARFAIEPAKLLAMHPDFSISGPQRNAFLNNRDSCILAATLGRRLGLRVGDRISIAGGIFHVTLNLTVAGFYNSPADNEALYFDNRYLNESLRERPNFAIMLMVLADRLDHVEAISRNIDELFQDSAVRTKTEPEKALQVSFMRYIGNIKLFLFWACAALTATVLLVCANTTAMSVRERVPEVGILKALGFPPGVVLWLIIGESALLAVVGGLIGFLCAQAMVGEFRRVPMLVVNFAGLNISPGIAVLGILLAAIVGVLASIPPAWEASRRAVVDCLSFAD